MGFAAIENVLYLLMESSDSALKLGIQRGLLAIPAHAMCAIFMGYYYGNAKYAKSYGDRAGCRKNLITGFLIACSLHGFYDFCLFTGNPIFILLFMIFVIVADIFTIIRIHQAKKQNQKMYEAPKFRQYWVNVNPYQAYGGYQAPQYGGYSYGGQQSGQNAQYQPQGMQQQYSQGQASQGQPQYGQGQAPQGAGSPYRQGFAPQGAESQYGQNMAPQGGQPQYGQPQTNLSYRPEQQTPPIVSQQEHYTPEVVQGNQPEQPQPVQPPQSSSSRSIQIVSPMRNIQIHCPVCGSINNFNAFFCGGCGASLHQLQ